MVRLFFYVQRALLRILAGYVKKNLRDTGFHFIDRAQAEEGITAQKNARHVSGVSLTVFSSGGVIVKMRGLLAKRWTR